LEILFWIVNVLYKVRFGGDYLKGKDVTSDEKNISRGDAESAEFKNKEVKGSWNYTNTIF